MYLSVNNICKSYTREIIKKADLIIRDNEFHCIFGSSGAGKTTLLNIITGMLHPDTGEILYEGKSIYGIKESEREKIRQCDIAYVMQGMTLLPHINVYQNIVLVNELTGLYYSEDKLNSILKTLRIENIKNSYPKQISGGEYRRVSFARALLQSPKILVTDEPTSNLDEKNRAIIRQVLGAYCSGGNSVIVTTHDLQFRDGNYIFHEMVDGFLLTNKP